MSVGTQHSTEVYNFSFKRGATYTNTFAFTDESDVAIPLTGAVARMDLRQTYESDVVALALSSPSGGLTVTAVAGEVDVLITPVQTAALPAGTYVFDLRLEYPSGRVDIFLQGTIEVFPTSTRAP